MIASEVMRRLTKAIWRELLAPPAERSYRAGLSRCCEHLNELPFHLPSEQKSERSLTALVKNSVAPGAQNQAFNAIVFPHPNLQQRKGERDRLGRTRRRLADGIRLLYSAALGESVPHNLTGRARPPGAPRIV